MILTAKPNSLTAVDHFTDVSTAFSLCLFLVRHITASITVIPNTHKMQPTPYNHKTIALTKQNKNNNTTLRHDERISLIGKKKATHTHTETHKTNGNNQTQRRQFSKCLTDQKKKKNRNDDRRESECKNDQMRFLPREHSAYVSYLWLLYRFRCGIQTIPNNCISAFRLSSMFRTLF